MLAGAGFYSDWLQPLKHEECIRRVWLIFLLLSAIIQSLLRRQKKKSSNVNSSQCIKIKRKRMNQIWATFCSIIMQYFTFVPLSSFSEFSILITLIILQIVRLQKAGQSLFVSEWGMINGTSGLSIKDNFQSK